MNEVEKSRAFSFRPEYLEMDPESYDGAAEELDGEWRRSTSVVEKKEGRFELHPILKIRAEDLHLREDHIGEGDLRSVHFVLFSKQMLPASPLGGKTAY